MEFIRQESDLIYDIRTTNEVIWSQLILIARIIRCLNGLYYKLLEHVEDRTHLKNNKNCTTNSQKKSHPVIRKI